MPALRAAVYRIVQFTDLHLGERNDTDALQLMRRVISAERPDLVVFTGDQVAGYAVAPWDPEATRALLWVKALSVAAEFGVPFATIFGNHDDQQYKTDPLLWHHWLLPGTFVALGLYALTCRVRVGRWLMVPLMLLVFLSIMTRPNTDTRRALLKLERQAYPRLSHTGDGDYRLVVRGVAADALALYFLDTGGGWIPEAIRRDQLNWLRRFDPMPSLAFMHIPPFGDGTFNASACQEGPAPLETTSRCPGSETVLQTLAAMGTRGVFVGHDHDNSWCCPAPSAHPPMLLCYGRHAGGYCILTPGARIIDWHWANATIETRVVE